MNAVIFYSVSLDDWAFKLFKIWSYVLNSISLVTLSPHSETRDVPSFSVSLRFPFSPQETCYTWEGAVIWASNIILCLNTSHHNLITSELNVDSKLVRGLVLVSVCHKDGGELYATVNGNQTILHTCQRIPNIQSQRIHISPLISCGIQPVSYF